jgi:hypothetical protein
LQDRAVIHRASEGIIKKVTVMKPSRRYYAVCSGNEFRSVLERASAIASMWGELILVTSMVYPFLRLVFLLKPKNGRSLAE